MNINTHTDHYREKGYCKITYYNTMAKIVPTLGQMTDDGLILRFAMEKWKQWRAEKMDKIHR